MKLLFDMNMSTKLPKLLELHGFSAIHWSSFGFPKAEDKEILCCARDNGFVIVTFDLDFGAILAATGLDSPSVIQIRCDVTSAEYLASSLVSIIKQFESELTSGALIVLDEFKARVRLLPLNMM
jgi:predicted nuclease of predicted toxin-antitoxin system